MKQRECPHCGESSLSACPHFHQYDLSPAFRPCDDYWQDPDAYERRAERDRQRELEAEDDGA